METKELKGREVFAINPLPGVFDYHVEDTSPMFGKKYRRFTKDGIAFVANAEDAFCKHFDDGEVYSVRLSVNAEGQLSLVGHTTTQQEITMAKTITIIDSYTVDNYLAGKLVSPEQLIAL